jgi:hypothetical protein
MIELMKLLKEDYARYGPHQAYNPMAAYHTTHEEEVRRYSECSN